MTNKLIYYAVALLATSAFAADTTPKDDVKAAAKQLSEKPNYSWKSTTENAGGGGGGGGGGRGGGRGRGPSEGKIEKDGYTHLVYPGRDDAKTDVFSKGEKGAIKTQDGWKSLTEAGAEEGPGAFMARAVKNFKAPAAQAAELADKVKELKKVDDAYKGDLTEEGAKSLLTFGGRGGGNGPEVSGAKGSATFWVKDGVLSKYAYKVQGTVSFNGNDREVDRTTTIEIKDVGTTKVEVPEEASKKASS
ncbi:MAG TPA: hypothetical protein VMF06_07430 [Candidatus Limnocylindria bacterium]|nr:hypothetical protein [Candidatus Limnocylindria bacterium]